MFVRQNDANSPSQTPHLTKKRIVELNAGRVLDRFGADGNQRRLRRQPAEENGFVRFPEPQQPMAGDHFGNIPAFQRGADDADVGFEDAEDRLVARFFEQQFQVISKPQSQNVKRGFFFDGDGFDEPLGFLDWFVSAVEIRGPSIGRLDANRRQTRFARLQDITFALQGQFDGFGEFRFGRPQRREIGEEGRIRRENEPLGWIGRAGHEWSLAIRRAWL